MAMVVGMGALALGAIEWQNLSKIADQTPVLLPAVVPVLHQTSKQELRKQVVSYCQAHVCPGQAIASADCQQCMKDWCGSTLLLCT